MDESLLQEIKAYAKEHNVPIILEESAEILTDTIKKCKPKRILEIGTAIGYSGIIMLMNSDAKLFTVEIDADSVAIARQNFYKAGFLDRVTFWEGDAEEIVRFLTGEFDFILLDGPKGHYCEFLPYLKKVLSKGGVIFADNVLFKGYTFMEKPIHKHRTIILSLREYLRQIENDTDFDSVLLSKGDGISIATKKR